MKKISIDGEMKREMTVGVFAFLVIAGLFLFTIVVSRDSFMGPKQRKEIFFDDVMGLRTGDGVVVRGMTIGTVKELDLVEGEDIVRVVCYLKERICLKTDYEITIVQTSMLGGRQLQVYEGTNSVVVPRRERIVGKPPHDIMVDVGEIVSMTRNVLERDGALQDFLQAVRHAREITEKINTGSGTLGLLVNDRELYDDLKKAGEGLEAITSELQGGDGTLAMLLGDEAMCEDLRASVQNLKEVTQRLADGKGMLGKLMSEDESLYLETREILRDVRAAVDDFRETAPVLTFTSVLFGAF